MTLEKTPGVPADSSAELHLERPHGLCITLPNPNLGPTDLACIPGREQGELVHTEMVC